MTITKRKIILGCFGLVMILCGGYFAICLYIASTMPWDTVYKDNMHDPEFRGEIEKWIGREFIGFEFPDSVEWEKSEYSTWLEATLHCLFTLPKKDIDLIFPPEKVTWHENDHKKLPQMWREWLKGKKLDHFKVMECKKESSLRGTVVVENPPGTDENQRVWVYLYFYDL